MKSEVRALEQAVCALVTKLDLIFKSVYGLDFFEVKKGLHISTPDHLSPTEDAFVSIHPVGWPKDSRISVRFYRGGGDWEVYEGGEIVADHLNIPVGRLHFKSATNAMGMILKPFFGDKEFVTTGYEHLAKSLKQDALDCIKQ